ncbi:vomeronasal type-2 receptor 26-like [Leptodactylus fuscus]|uniref:vomeronasal type-2 receptor 26-like n=1 Tax=Leptodactylus fuscus TaxID=238119 RepID=UPI003F4E4D30
MDPVFNDRIQFPSVYRTVPNEYQQFQVILQLLLHFNWTWVGIVSTDDDSNNKALEELRQLLPGALNYYLKNVKLTNLGEDIFFTPGGDVVNGFDIYNWILYRNGTDIPQSLCSETCLEGKRKALQRGKMLCCFDCVPCSEGEIANLSGMENCIKCPEDSWPNENKTMCIQRTIEYLSYDDYLGSALAAIAIIFTVISTSVMIIFVKNGNTAIVRANNQHLSYVLLMALTLSFTCSLLFIGHPMELTCLLRHSLFLSIYSVAISSLLGKTITVIIAFKATKPGSKFQKWMSLRTSIGLTVLCSLGEFLICVMWVTCAPPIVESDSKTSHDKLILQCTDISMFYFYLAISYIVCLALLSFIIAYSARKLPDNFNEAQYITFSMIMFCSVWLSFIPSYVSAKGKYMVAVEIFAILISTAGLLVCIFAPKCYIIILRPELNHKRHLNITRKR